MQLTGQCSFTDHEVKSKLTQKRKLAQCILRLLHHYTGKQALIQYTFVSDAFLYNMNLKHLQHDDYTDIITFDLSEPNNEMLTIDIYISTERVKENAKLHQVSYATELLRVIFHGALHIAGFGDKTAKAKLKMRAEEDFWIQEFLTHA
ncbi:MAG: rRNA maturation RNase YbeY [Chitinophagaceae bacterium]|jgi:probable rRNA maturation factor|nr:rRNA maturation RNase YbeY [Chitinophagaceae bacterium]